MNMLFIKYLCVRFMVSYIPVVSVFGYINSLKSIFYFCIIQNKLISLLRF